MSENKEIIQPTEYEKRLAKFTELGMKTYTIQLESGLYCIVKAPGMREVAIQQTALLKSMAGSMDATLDGGIAILENIHLWSEFDFKTNGVINDTEEVKEAAMAVYGIVEVKNTVVKKN